MVIQDDQHTSNDINAIHDRIRNGNRTLTSSTVSIMIQMFGDTSTVGTVQANNVNLMHHFQCDIPH